TKEGRFIDCNQAMLDMLGYESKEEFLSINIEKDLYVNPEDRRRFQREIEEKGYVKDYEINFKKKTGEEISVLVTCNSLLDNKGEVIGYQGLNIDITERKRMEREVREATKRFQKISEMGDDGIIVFDQVYQIEFANMMAVDITGFSQEELMGMDFNLLLNERDQKFLADMHSEVGEDENRRLCLEMEINTAAGGSKEVEVCITIAKGEGRGLRTYAYIRDITLRKKMEREIREANEFLSKMIESSVNCVVATDMKGDILIFNKGAEKLLGYKTEEVVGKMSIRNVYPPGVAKEVMEKMRSPDY
ncbi:MAG: PAS domain S-box protein, partial [Thermodesulfovibrionia bacterium]|nr:PAS domain S-box protein [Thermodesulfovibrionia bacterium]